MESTMCFEVEAGSPPRENLAFLALPAKHASARVTGTTNDMFKAAQAILNQAITEVCSRRTAAEFEAARQAVFAQYMLVTIAMGNVISAVVEPKVIERLSWESFSEMESDFRESVGSFGKDIADQAIFTVWTLRKINEIVSRVKQSEETRERINKVDPKLAQDFVYHIIASRFHLDCLRVSLRCERVLYPEVLESISEGLRSLVNAYAYIRQATDVAHVDEAIIHIDFDEEEQELVALSMKDVIADASA
ncbi:MAG TPA: hypothetical protein VHW46_08595 [Terracidiphilus sp.]|jgi:hypothetical protein|nr:hypothetical protein [Terracidiphilus sp.]